MSWIESHQTLKEHPKLHHFAGLLRISRPAAIGHLHCLWWWAMDYAEEGSLSEYADLTIARASLWTRDPVKFVEALTASGWMDSDRTIHNWEKYVGKLLDKRESDARRKREERARTSSGHPRDGAGTVPDLTEPYPTDRTVPTLARKRDELFEAVAEVSGIDWTNGLTQRSRSSLNAAVGDLRQAGASAEEVRRRAANWPYDVPITPNGLAKQWPALDSPQRVGKTSNAQRIMRQALTLAEGES